VRQGLARIFEPDVLVVGSQSSSDPTAVALASKGERAKRLNVERLKNATAKWMLPNELHDLSRCELISRREAHPTSARPLTGASRPTGKVRSRDLHEIARYSGRIRVPEDVLRLVVVAAQTCIHALFAESNDTAIPLGNASSQSWLSLFLADYSKIP
jgi:hypothetical protein